MNLASDSDLNRCNSNSVQDDSNNSVASSEFSNDDKIANVKETQTDIDMDALSELFKELDLKTSLIHNLKKQVFSLELSEESFIGNDTKTKYFTGLNSYKVLMLLHSTISPYLFTRSTTSLSTFQQLLLTLMKLRLNLPFQYLSYKYVPPIFYNIFLSLS